MNSSALDETDRRLVRELQRDGRAPFSQIAAAIGVSEHTVARRYRRLCTVGLRVIGVPGPYRAAATRWLLRISCTPTATTKIADALARRRDTAWVALASGGTELHCAFATRTSRERDTLLLDKLPHTPQVVSVSAYCLLHAFPGASDAWQLPTPDHDNIEPADADPPPAAPPTVTDGVDAQLMAELATDGRVTIAKLARATRRSPAAVTRHMDQLRASTKLRLAVDFLPHHLGYDMLVRFWLRVAPGQLDAVGTALAAHPEITYAAASTGAANLVATAMFTDSEEFYHYLDHRLGAMPGVQSIETTPILREVKRLTYPTER